MFNSKEIKAGDIYLIDFGKRVGSEQQGVRPAVVVSNNRGNLHSPTMIVAPITSSIGKKKMITHVDVKATDSPLALDSIVLCENIEHISKERIIKYIGYLNQYYMKKVARATMLAFSLVSYLDDNELIDLREVAIKLNKIKEED